MHVLSLEEGLKRHPVFLQLQFLPLLYAPENDYVVVTSPPPESYINQLTQLGFSSLPHLLCIDAPISRTSFQEVIAWGKSHEVANWAKERQLPFFMPSWQSVLRVNSKEFSYLNSPQLPYSQLIHNQKELTTWLNSYGGNKVLKKCLGLSGRGNLVIEGDKALSHDQVHAFCLKEWTRNRPVIAEPWVERILDFSTQWEIETTGTITYIGAAIITNNARGAYQSTHVDEESKLFGIHLPFLEKHKAAAKQILHKVAEAGYFGPVGIDAMIYQDIEDSSWVRLHPIVEINARQTMSLFALLFQRRWFKGQSIILNYATAQKNLKKQGLLPENLKIHTSEILKFSKQLFFSDAHVSFDSNYQEK